MSREIEYLRGEADAADAVAVVTKEPRLEGYALNRAADFISSLEIDCSTSPPGYAITFGRRDDALEARAGVLVRLGRHVGVDTWIFGLSVGQVLATCKSEIDALGLDATSFRIRKPDEKLAWQSGGLRHWLAVAAWLAVFIAIMLAMAARG